MTHRTPQVPTHRTLFSFRVRPDLLDEYERDHAAVWPEMLAALAESGWRNYSLFSRGDGEIIGYFESDDPDHAQRAMNALDVNTRWQAAMERYFDGRGPAASLNALAPIFHLETQLDQAHNTASAPAREGIAAHPAP
ncbi:L-rhamnose mutarotase [Micrococcales bacterium 31B]|nr:L-rhamnose mutarotase [Micrococcales bacterium 31B]